MFSNPAREYSRKTRRPKPRHSGPLHKFPFLESRDYAIIHQGLTSCRSPAIPDSETGVMQLVSRPRSSKQNSSKSFHANAQSPPRFFLVCFACSAPLLEIWVLDLSRTTGTRDEASLTHRIRKAMRKPGSNRKIWRGRRGSNPRPPT